MPWKRSRTELNGRQLFYHFLKDRFVRRNTGSISVDGVELRKFAESGKEDGFIMKKKILKRTIAALLLAILALLSGCSLNNAVPSQSQKNAGDEMTGRIYFPGATHSTPSVTETSFPDTFETVSSSQAETSSRPESETVFVPETTTVPKTTAAPDTAANPETTLHPGTTSAPATTEEPKDTEAPFFLYLVSAPTLDRGREFDLHRYIAYIDDLDPEVELSVEGSVDPENLGEYPLQLTLTDDAGNSTSANLTVKVTEPAQTAPVTPETPKSFASFAETYRRDGAMVGIDVSKWQGEIDFSRVAAAGCEFVIIRIGGCTDEPFEDRYFLQNLKNAKAAGLPVGIYWYSEENSPEQIRENAEFLYALLDGAELDFPIFFDWEDFRDFEDYHMSMRDLNALFFTFREEAEARGYRAVLYNSKIFLNLVWSEEAKEGGVWLAHYTEQTNYDGAYFLWQQGLGRIDGIQGDVDVDVLYPEYLP